MRMRSEIILLTRLSSFEVDSWRMAESFAGNSWQKRCIRTKLISRLVESHFSRNVYCEIIAVVKFISGQSSDGFPARIRIRLCHIPFHFHGVYGNRSTVTIHRSEHVSRRSCFVNLFKCLSLLLIFHPTVRF